MPHLGGEHAQTRSLIQPPAARRQSRERSPEGFAPPKASWTAWRAIQGACCPRATSGRPRLPAPHSADQQHADRQEPDSQGGDVGPVEVPHLARSVANPSYSYSPHAFGISGE